MLDKNITFIVLMLEVSVLELTLELHARDPRELAAVLLGREPIAKCDVGARVTVDAGESKQIREIRSGGSYLSQNDLRTYFGLGSYGGSVDVEVRMPGGRTWRWRGQPIDRVITLTLDDRSPEPDKRN